MAVGMSVAISMGGRLGHAGRFVGARFPGRGRGLHNSKRLKMKVAFQPFESSTKPYRRFHEKQAVYRLAPKCNPPAGVRRGQPGAT